MLDWALDTCQCEAEEVNIRAAIQGYQSGEISYSENFTLIYAGHIVDICPTYQSFCEDRQERLDRYSARFGPGWLWHEPPLSSPGLGPLAKKGVCLQRRAGTRNYNIGNYPINMGFAVDATKVARLGKDAKTSKKATSKESPLPSTEVMCCFKTLLDSGATYPFLPITDLRRLSIDLRWYPAQGVTNVLTVTGQGGYRFFEMVVSVRSKHGGSLVSEGAEAVWPAEPRILGGFYPVCANPIETENPNYSDRLSGMVPFESCYISSAPSMYEVWIGEDRRDVLGTRRLPAHMRYTTDKIFDLEYPDHFKNLRSEQKTPDEVIFVHRLNGQRHHLSFVDGDWPSVRGKSELSILKKEFKEPGQPPRTTITRRAIIEPRKGTYREQEAQPTWRDDFLDRAEFKDKKYKDIGDVPGV